MMPSLDHCVNNSSEMTTLTKTLEVFDTYKHREDKDSDEESFHLPLDDDEADLKVQEPVRNGNGTETEEDILDKFDVIPPAVENIDPPSEERSLNDEAEEKKVVENGTHSDQETKEDEVVKEQNGPVNGIDSEKTPESPKDNQVPTEEKEETSEESPSPKCDDAIETDDVPIVDLENDCSSDKETSAIEPIQDEEAQTEESKEKEADSNIPVQNDDSKEPDNIEEQKEDKVASPKTDDKPEKSDDISDISKHNEDSEDLFDISIIRDAEEDNAENAYNEAHPEETEDYEDQTDEKMEDEGMDIDKQEEHLKAEDVDIEEDNLKLECEATKDSVSDGEGENSKKTDIVVVDNEQKDSRVATNGAANSVKECRLDEVTGSLTGDDGREINYEDSLMKETKEEDETPRNSVKRPLPEETEASVTKKLRTEAVVADVDTKELEKPKEKLPLKNLLSLSDFMKSRKHNKRLTMHDLEDFCVQKICEVIVHKSELGDVHHQLRLQEQLIETMRKEIHQLTKQAKDLEIVNKKLLNDLKQQNTTQKPLNPLKITRSVGLQVKFTPTFEANLKRRQPNAVVNQKVQAQATPNRSSRVIPNAVASTVTRQVLSPQKQQILPKPNTPILSQALQNRRTALNESANKIPNQINRAKPADPKTGSPSASVIDLTDEDDKKDKTKTTPAKMVPPKNIAVPLRTTPMRVNATQGIRLTTAQGKVSPITSVVTSSAPQLMYVVQSSPQNVLSPLGPKAVVVNFQSANGVLTSTLNGSAVSVIPKQSNTIQLKPVAAAKTLQQNNKLIKLSNKHPAPLPPPPIVRVSTDKTLKPIPPKPHLTIRKTETGIILQWKMPYELDMYEVIASYQLYAYQETSALPSTDMWRKVGDVKALALPMACTLTQFADKNKYYFAVRPVDIHKRIGMFSDPEEISL